MRVAIVSTCIYSLFSRRDGSKCSGSCRYFGLRPVAWSAKVVDLTKSLQRVTKMHYEYFATRVSTGSTSRGRSGRRPRTACRSVGTTPLSPRVAQSILGSGQLVRGRVAPVTMPPGDACCATRQPCGTVDHLTPCRGSCALASRPSLSISLAFRRGIRRNSFGAGAVQASRQSWSAISRCECRTESERDLGENALIRTVFSAQLPGAGT